MAEINSGGGGKGKKKGGKKMSPRVDMTPMVDLAFLLITFFMLTTSFSDKFFMQVTMPDKTQDDQKQKIRKSQSITVILGEEDKVYWYDDPEKPELHQTGFSSNGIRKLLLDRQKVVDSLIVVIKPMNTSRYSNLVDIMDEITITKTPISAIVDITPEDEQLVTEYKKQAN